MIMKTFILKKQKKTFPQKFQKTKVSGDNRQKIHNLKTRFKQTTEVRTTISIKKELKLFLIYSTHFQTRPFKPLTALCRLQGFACRKVCIRFSNTLRSNCFFRTLLAVVVQYGSFIFNQSLVCYIINMTCFNMETINYKAFIIHCTYISYLPPSP